MLYQVMASLRFHLTEKLPDLSKVQFMHDGVNLSSLKKPFATIEYLAEPTELISAGRMSVQETYHFQVGFFAANFETGLKQQSELKEALQEAVPLYNESLIKTNARFVCDVSDFTPIRNSDTANRTFDFHGYYDVSVSIIRDVGSTNFTQ